MRGFLVVLAVIVALFVVPLAAAQSAGDRIVSKAPRVIASKDGHDSFLLPIPRYVEALGAFLNRVHTEATSV